MVGDFAKYFLMLSRYLAYSTARFITQLMYLRDVSSSWPKGQGLAQVMRNLRLTENIAIL